MRELISIIVPVYKVEQYLEKCVYSILNQTYQNLELILIDDGSPDKCPKICEKLAQVDSRIIVIHKKNGGLSSARNAGIDIAKGDYIGFVDSDDYIDKQMYEKLYNNMKKYDADISIGKFQKVYETSEIKTEFIDEVIDVWSRKEALSHLYDKKYFGCEAWNKLYKRYILDDIRFPEGKIYEDEFTVHRFIERANKIVNTNQICYYYLQRNVGIIRSNFTAARLDILVALRDRMELFREKYPSDLYLLVYKQYIKRVLRLAFQVKFYKRKDKKMYKQLKEEYKRIYRLGRKENVLPKENRLIYKIVYHNFALNNVFQLIEVVIQRIK